MSYVDWPDFDVGIITLVLGSFFGVAVSYALYYLRHGKPNETRKRKSLCLPAGYRYIGSLMLFLVPVILAGDLYSSFQKNGNFGFPDPILFFVVFPIFTVGVLLLLYCRNYEIIFDQGSIISRGVFRKKKVIRWEEIEKVGFGHSAFILFDLTTRIEVVSILVGFDLFLEILKEKVPEQVSEEAFRKYELFLKRS